MQLMFRVLAFVVFHGGVALCVGLSVGRDLTLVCCRQGTAPIHLAAARGHVAAIECLHSKGADVNLKDE
jgi:hypothetical protein